MVEAQKDFIQEKETKIIKGNVAAAYAAKSARVQVISAYPITPQTTVFRNYLNLQIMERCQELNI